MDLWRALINFLPEFCLIECFPVCVKKSLMDLWRPLINFRPEICSKFVSRHSHCVQFICRFRLDSARARYTVSPPSEFCVSNRLNKMRSQFPLIKCTIEPLIADSLDTTHTFPALTREKKIAMKRSRRKKWVFGARMCIVDCVGTRSLATATVQCHKRYTFPSLELHTHESAAVVKLRHEVNAGDVAAAFRAFYVFSVECAGVFLVV